MASNSTIPLNFWTLWERIKLAARGIRAQTRDEILPASEPEPESKSVEEEALLNSLILKKILGYLGDAGDLLNCRAVCSDWKFLADEILLKRKSLKIKLRYDETTGAYFKTTGNSYSFSNALSLRSEFDQFLPLLQDFPLKNLRHLINLAGAGEISSPFQFPCVSFEIVAGDLEADDLSSFLHFYGERIKKLGLIFCPYEKKRSPWMSMNSRRVFPKVITVRNLLDRQLPNLEELEIFNMKNYDFDYPPWQEMFAFHNLFEQVEVEFDLDSTATQISPGATKKLMIAQLPKLQKLRFSINEYHFFHSLYSENNDPPKSVILKNMLDSKSVEFPQISDVNLRCVDCGEALISLNQVGKLKKLQVAVLGLDLMEKIIDKVPSQLQFHFSEFDINFVVELVRQLMNDQLTKTRMIRVLNTIFEVIERNSDTQVSIFMDQRIGLLYDAGFEIPVMENVSTLALKKSSRPNEWSGSEVPPPFFPSGFSLSDSFPNLKSLTLFKWHGDIFADLWGQNCQSLPTVQNFSLVTHWSEAREFSAAGFSKLPEMFPNLRKVAMRSFMNFPEFAPCLWKLEELEYLKIVLFVGIGSAHLSAPGNSNSNLNSNEMGAIDSAITGFTIETCQKMRESEEFLEWARNAAKSKKTREQNENEGEQEKSGQNLDPLDSVGFSDWPVGESISIESLRVNPSICHLPKLKTFWIEFVDGAELEKDSYFLISELSGLFAFYLMPQLEVHLHPEAENYENLQRMEKHLEEMKAYIK